MSPLPRALVSLLVIAISAGLLAIAVRLQPAPPPPPGALVEPVLDVAPDQVQAIDIRSWQGRMAAVREDGHWRVDALELRANEGVSAAERPSQEILDGVIGDLVRAVVATPEIDRFDASDQPLSAFGLGEPQATIRLVLDDGGERTLEIGGLTSTGSALYARILPGEAIVAIGNPIFNDIQAALYRLRALAKAAPAC
jgi:hypothetical protein